MRALALLVLLVAELAAAQPNSNGPPLELQDEGTPLGNIRKLNCAGAGVTCSRTGIVGEINVPGGGAGSCGGSGGQVIFNPGTGCTGDGQLVWDNTLKTLTGGAFRDKGGAVWNVRAYGATGDAVEGVGTDDTTALRAAASACSSAGGGTIYLPHSSTNRYLVKIRTGTGGPVITTPPKCKWFCDAGVGFQLADDQRGHGETLMEGRLLANATGAAQQNGEGIEIDNCTFDGNTRGQINPAASGSPELIYCAPATPTVGPGCSLYKFTNNTLLDTQYQGLTLYRGTGAKISNNLWFHVNQRNGACSDTRKCSATITTTCTVDGDCPGGETCLGNCNADALQLNGTEDTTVDHNSLINASEGIVFQHATGNIASPSQRGTISNNLIVGLPANAVCTGVGQPFPCCTGMRTGSGVGGEGGHNFCDAGNAVGGSIIIVGRDITITGNKLDRANQIILESGRGYPVRNISVVGNQQRNSTANGVTLLTIQTQVCDVTSSRFNESCSTNDTNADTGCPGSTACASAVGCCVNRRVCNSGTRFKSTCSQDDITTPNGCGPGAVCSGTVDTLTSCCAKICNSGPRIDRACTTDDITGTTGCGSVADCVGAGNPYPCCTGAAAGATCGNAECPGCCVGSEQPIDNIDIKDNLFVRDSTLLGSACIAAQATQNFAPSNLRIEGNTCRGFCPTGSAANTCAGGLFLNNQGLTAGVGFADIGFDRNTVRDSGSYMAWLRGLTSNLRLRGNTSVGNIGAVNFAAPSAGTTPVLADFSDNTVVNAAGVPTFPLTSLTQIASHVDPNGLVAHQWCSDCNHKKPCATTLPTGAGSWATWDNGTTAGGDESWDCGFAAPGIDGQVVFNRSGTGTPTTAANGQFTTDSSSNFSWNEAARALTLSITGGVAGGRAYGSNQASGQFHLESTSNATKNFIGFGLCDPTLPATDPSYPLCLVYRDGTGFLGIGAGFAPQQRVVIEGNGTQRIQLRAIGATGADLARFQLHRAAGTQAVPTLVTTGLALGAIDFGGLDSNLVAPIATANLATGGTILGTATETWSTTAHGTRVGTFVTANTTTTNCEATRVDQDGSISLFKPPTAGVCSALVSKLTGAATQAINLNYTAPDSHATGFLRNNGAGVLTWAAGGGTGTVVDCGTESVGQLAYWTGTNLQCGNAVLTLVNPATTPLLTYGGQTVFTEATLTLANGLNSNVALSTATNYRITGPTAAFSIDGLAAGVTGQIITIRNDTNQNLTWVNDATSVSAAANQLRLPYAVNVVTGFLNRSARSFVYSTASGVGKWYALDTTTSHFLVGGEHADVDSTTFTGAPGEMFARATAVPNAWSQVAPNTTATRKFLRMTGTGAAGTLPLWDTLVAGDLAAHNLLSAQHGDTTTGTVARGDLVTGQGVSATWTRLALGTAGKFVQSNGTDAVWSALTLPTAAVTSGGLVYSSSTTALSVSGLMDQNELVLGGGAGGAPVTTVTGGLGTTVQVLHGNAAGVPAWGSVVPGDFGTQTANTVLAGPTSGGAATPTFRALVDADVPDTITLSNLTQITTRSHSDLQNLSADDHTQYALLAGRSGGQTLIGGTLTTNNLTLTANSADTTGRVKLNTFMSYADGGLTLTDATPLNQTAYTADVTLGASHGFGALTVGAPPTLTEIFFGNTYDSSVGLLVTGTGGTFGTATVFNFEPRIRAATTVTAGTVSAFLNQPRFAVAANAITFTVNNTGGYPSSAAVVHAPGFNRVSTLVSGTGVFQDVTAVYSAGTVGSMWSGDNWRGLHMLDPGGTGTITNVGAVDIAALTRGGTLTFGIRSAITAAATRYFLLDTGGAQSSLAGKFTKYNNTTAEGLGLAGIYKEGISGTQTAAVTIATLTPPASGRYRINATITSTSGTNTGTVGLTLDYKDSQGTTHTADVLPLIKADGTVVLTATAASKEFQAVTKHFTANTGTNIVLKSTVTGTVAYTVAYAIEELG